MQDTVDMQHGFEEKAEDNPGKTEGAHKDKGREVQGEKKGPPAGVPYGIPSELAVRMAGKACEARAALSIVKSTPGLSERARKAVVSRFKANASELSARFDTIASVVPDADLDAFAKYLGCRWKPSSRRLEILMPLDLASIKTRRSAVITK